MNKNEFCIITKYDVGGKIEIYANQVLWNGTKSSLKYTKVCLVHINII